MKTHFIKKDTIVKIVILLKKENTFYLIDKINEIKIFNFVFLKEKKFITTWFGKPIKNEDIFKKNYIENDIIYYKPHIIFFNNMGDNFEVFFENENDLYQWLDNNFPNYKSFLKING